MLGLIPYSADDADDPTTALPVATIGLIVLNFLVFFYELALGAQGSLDAFLNSWSLVPCEYTSHCAPFVGTPTPFWLTLFSSMFLHAGWAHILGNMVFLYVFGIHVERSMGAVRYVLFYLLCGLGANALEIVTAVDSNLPGLGASGAISGVLAGYLVLYPSSHVKTLIPLGFFLLDRAPARVRVHRLLVPAADRGGIDVPELCRPGRCRVRRACRRVRHRSGPGQAVRALGAGQPPARVSRGLEPLVSAHALAKVTPDVPSSDERFARARTVDGDTAAGSSQATALIRRT